MKEQAKEVSTRSSALEEELYKLRREHDKLFNKYDKLSNEHNSQTNEIGALRSQKAELEGEKLSLIGWKRRAESLSIELEERRRMAEAGLEQPGAKVDTKLSDELRRKARSSIHECMLIACFQGKGKLSRA